LAVDWLADLLGAGAGGGAVDLAAEECCVGADGVLLLAFGFAVAL
jgi:hypothetical protein